MELSREEIEKMPVLLRRIPANVVPGEYIDALCDMALASINGPKLSRAYKKEVGRGKD